MDWKQKWAAVRAFSGKCEPVMRKPDDWYISANMEVGGNSMLTSKYGNGATVEKAIEDHWDIYSNLPDGLYAVTGWGDKQVRARWNGFMWKPVEANDA